MVKTCCGCKGQRQYVKLWKNTCSGNARRTGQNIRVLVEHSEPFATWIPPRQGTHRSYAVGDIHVLFTSRKQIEAVGKSKITTTKEQRRLVTSQEIGVT